MGAVTASHLTHDLAWSVAARVEDVRDDGPDQNGEKKSKKDTQNDPEGLTLGRTTDLCAGLIRGVGWLSL